MSKPTPPQPAPPDEPRRIASEQILQGDRLVTIVHQNTSYRLIATKNGKLILQK